MTAGADRAPDEEALARLALTHLPGLGPARGRWLLSGPCTAAEVFQLLARGALPVGLGSPPPGVSAQLVDSWHRAARRLDPAERWQAHHTAGLQLLTPNDPSWPFASDPEPPLIVWTRGRLDLLALPTVAVVGSRRCTSIGSRVAYSLGRDLVEAGVVVASGLAAGIDAAAHRGALTAGDRVVAVVGTGADVIYPRSSASLWDEVAARGLMIGEAPLGVQGQRWRFPARNRLLAALSRLVVVVESHHRGGALHTVAEAERRQVPVLAVPGSVLSAASVGTNQLLFDGVGLARDARDVLEALGMAPPLAAHDGSRTSAPEPNPTAEVLARLGAGPVPLDELLGPGSEAGSAVLVQRLLNEGRVQLSGGMVSLGGPP